MSLNCYTFAKTKKVLWKTWLDEIIYHEIIYLSEIDYFFHQIKKMIDSNPKLKVENIFYDYFNQTFVDSVCMAIRRQVDNRKDVCSLYRLLVDCKASGKLSKTGEIPSKIIIDDIKKMESIKKKFKPYYDAGIAHRSLMDVGTVPIPIPKWEDIPVAVRDLQDIYKTYSQIFDGIKVHDFTCHIDGTWTNIFKMSWSSD